MRLTAEEIRDSLEWLTQWHAPIEVQEYSRRLMAKLGDEHIFQQAGVNFIYEVFAAGQFAKLRGAEAVRKIKDLRPDVELKFVDGVVERYEIVEADVPGRRRGDEYKNIAESRGVAELWPVEDWATPSQAREAIETATSLKAKKAQVLANIETPYPSDTGLLIYLNLVDFGVHQAEIIATFLQAVELARKWFNPIWIMWNGNIYNCTSQVVA